MTLEDEFRRVRGPRIMYKGREVWLHHQFPIANGKSARVKIESFDIDWGGLGKTRFREGVGLMIDREMRVGDLPCRLLTIWPHEPPITQLRPPAEELRRIEFGNVHAEAGIKHRLCLWLDEPLQTVEVVCYTRDNHLHVWNVWNDGNWWHGVDGRHNGAGMIVEEIENGFRYHCNDGYPDEDFNDIVFRIERCEE
jgi:hypothetical protein